VRVDAGTCWLDFGCGNGGLVRYCRQRFGCHAVGFEPWGLAKAATRHGIPLVAESDLDRLSGGCDIVSAIEVLEHTDDPVGTLQRIRQLLRPDGLLFCTTGNARPFRNRLAAWRYVIPEIHISFFEPETLRHALLTAGFEPEFRGRLPGFTDIMRFKILKDLRIRRRGRLEQLAPWRAAARLAESRVRLFEHPLGWAR
jgi:SAM-dependent methyltransferase